VVAVVDIFAVAIEEERAGVGIGHARRAFEGIDRRGKNGGSGSIEIDSNPIAEAPDIEFLLCQQGRGSGNTSQRDKRDDRLKNPHVYSSGSFSDKEMERDTWQLIIGVTVYGFHR
jgi:hypothetical protein